MSKLDNIRNDDGKLPSFAWPGGYPIAYLDSGDNVLCPNCANLDVEDFEPEVTGYFIHWEGDDEFCTVCWNAIESAYGPIEED